MVYEKRADVMDDRSRFLFTRTMVEQRNIQLPSLCM